MEPKHLSRGAVRINYHAEIPNARCAEVMLAFNASEQGVGSVSCGVGERTKFTGKRQNEPARGNSALVMPLGTE